MDAFATRGAAAGSTAARWAAEVNIAGAAIAGVGLVGRTTRSTGRRSSSRSGANPPPTVPGQLAELALADWLGQEREQLLDRLAVAMVNELRRPSGLDSRKVDHATFRLDRHSFDQLTGQLWRCRTAHIQAAIERADYEDAAVRTLVCAATPIRSLRR
jgi:hypothetical protein